MSQIGNIFNFGEISPDDAQLGQALSFVQRFNSPWMPLSWAGRGLTALGENSWLPAIGFLTLILGLSLGVSWLSLVMAERWFYSGWAGMQIVSTKKKPSRRRSPSRTKRTSFLFSWISSNIRAIIRKDMLVLRRDLRNLSQLVTPLIFGVIYAIMLLRNSGEVPAGQSQAPTWFMQTLNIALVYSSVGIAIFVGWMLLARLATMSFSQEHHSYWILKSAPINVRQMLTAKFLVAYLPTLFLGWAFLTVIILLQKAPLGIWVYGLFVVAFCNAGLAGLNLAFGVTGARFDWKDPRRMATTSTGCLSSLVSMIYLAINLILFFGPPIIFAAVGQPQIVGQVLGGQFGAIMSIICALLPLWMVRKRVPHLGEDTN
jgi:ABC-2 type transport system permease protein